MLAIVVCLSMWSVMPAAVGITSTVVMSDSMAPGIRAGDVVLAQPVNDRPRMGQVLLVEDPDHPGRLRLHRFIAQRDQRMVLKGDANPSSDSSTIEPAAVHAIGFERLPAIGLPLLWMRTGRWVEALASCAGLTLLLVACDLHDVASRDERVEPRRRRGLGALIPGVLVIAVISASATEGTIPAASARFTRTASSPTSTFASVSDYACNSRTQPGNPILSWAFDATTGTTETDRSTAKHDGTLNTPIRAGTGCSLAAGGRFITTATGSDFVSAKDQLTVPASTTVAAWIRLSSSTKSGRVIGFGDRQTTSSTYSDRVIFLDALGTVHAGVQTSSGACLVAGPTPIGDTAWHHLASTYNATTNQLVVYVDNISRSTTCIGTPMTGPGYWRAGSDNIGSATLAGLTGVNNYLTGSIDEAVVYGSALPATSSTPTTPSITTIWTLGH